MFCTSIVHINERTLIIAITKLYQKSLYFENLLLQFPESISSAY